MRKFSFFHLKSLQLRWETFIFLLSVLNLATAQLNVELDGVGYTLRVGSNLDKNAFAENCKSLDQVVTDLKQLQSITKNIQISSITDCNTADVILQALQQVNGLGLWIGLWTGANGQNFEAERLALLALIQTRDVSSVAGVHITNEDLSLGQSIQFRNSIKDDLVANSLNNIPVVVDFDVQTLIDLPQLIALDSTTVYVNTFPFYDQSTNINDATKSVEEQIALLASDIGTKQLVIGKTGWADGGASTMANPANEPSLQKYLLDFHCLAQGKQWKYFWYMAYDSLWQQGSSGDNVEGHFGLFDEVGHLKPYLDGFSIDCSKPSEPIPDPATATFAPMPTASPTFNPTNPPTAPQPTSTPTYSPTTAQPTHAPTNQPTTAQPTHVPTNQPTTAQPTPAPTNQPTTAQPTPAPTNQPTTAQPTPVPTNQPTTAQPTPAPTNQPTTAQSTPVPTNQPTTAPPTPAPTGQPTTLQPTSFPTDQSTPAPTHQPTTIQLTPAPTATITTQPATIESSPFPTAKPNTANPTSSPKETPSSESNTRPSPMPSSMPTIKQTASTEITIENLQLFLDGVSVLEDSVIETFVQVTEDWYYSIYGKKITSTRHRMIQVAPAPLSDFETIIVVNSQIVEGGSNTITYEQSLSFETSLHDPAVDPLSVIMDPFTTDSLRVDYYNRLRDSDPAFAGLSNSESTLDTTFARTVDDRGTSQNGESGNIMLVGVLVAVAVVLAVSVMAVFVVRRRQIHERRTDGVSKVGPGPDIKDHIERRSNHDSDNEDDSNEKSKYFMDVEEESLIYCGEVKIDQEQRSVASTVDSSRPIEVKSVSPWARFGPEYTDPQNIFTVSAPAGKLGAVIDISPNNGPPMIYALKKSSLLRDKVKVGDRVLAVNDIDVSEFSVAEVCRIIAQYAETPKRIFTIIRLPEPENQ